MFCFNLRCLNLFLMFIEYFKNTEIMNLYKHFLYKYHYQSSKKFMYYIYFFINKLYKKHENQELQK